MTQEIEDFDNSVVVHLWGSSSKAKDEPAIFIYVPDSWMSDEYYEKFDEDDDTKNFLIPLYPILEWYLREFKEQDGGENIPTFVSWLRAYADRLEMAYSDQIENP